MVIIFIIGLENHAKLESLQKKTSMNPYISKLAKKVLCLFDVYFFLRCLFHLIF
jgi:hypothetical protein